MHKKVAEILQFGCPINKDINCQKSLVNLRSGMIAEIGAIAATYGGYWLYSRNEKCVYNQEVLGSTYQLYKSTTGLLGALTMITYWVKLASIKITYLR